MAKKNAKKTNLKSPGKSKAPKPAANRGPDRDSRRAQRIHTDLFKSSLAEFQRWMGWGKNPDPAEFTGVPHIHFYRTFNADGVNQEYTTPVASHFHKVDVVLDENKKPKLDEKGRIQITIGPPLQMTRVGKGKASKIVPMRIPLYKRVDIIQGEGTEVQVYDDHKHDATYLRSDTVEIREVSQGAQFIIDLLGSNIFDDKSGKMVPVPTMPGGAGNTRDLRPDAPVDR